jgi:hypothetical protein
MIENVQDYPALPCTRKSVRRKSDVAGLSGRWRVAELPDLTDDYLAETRNPHVNLTVKKRDLSIQGDYQFGLQSGVMDGEVVQEERRTEGGVVKTVRILFSFEGNDEMDEVHGYGDAILSEDERTLTGRMHYHYGDTYRFVWKRLHK